MGTRSATLFIDGNQTVCHLYRQYDGYPAGHGVDLARACNVRLCNGFGGEQTAGKWANGISCLAAQVVARLKTGIGNIYLHGLDENPSDWVEYVYVVTSAGLGQPPRIACTTQTGPWPFNVQTSAGHVFTGTPRAWLERFAAPTPPVPASAVAESAGAS